MADFTALLSSIVQAASEGITLAGTLRDASDTLVSVEKRLQGIDRDIDLTSRALAQLGAHLEDPEVQELVSDNTIRVAKDVAAECAAIFQQTEEVVKKIKETGSTGKEPYHIREAKMDVLRVNLGRVEANLDLLNGVIVHGRPMSTGTPDPVAFAAHREAIGELMAEKEEHTQKYLALKIKYDALARQAPGYEEAVASSATANGGEGSSTTNGGAEAPRRSSIDKTPAIFRESPSDAQASTSSTPTQLPSAFLASLPPSPYSDKENNPPVEPTPDTASPPPATTSTPDDTPTPEAPTAPARPRNKFVSAAKKTAKGAGIALSVTVAIILAPAAVSDITRNRRRRKFLAATAAQQPTTGTGAAEDTAIADGLYKKTASVPGLAPGQPWTQEDDNALAKDGFPLRAARLQREKWEREQAEKRAAAPEYMPMRYIAGEMRGEVVGVGELGDENRDVQLVDWVFAGRGGEGREAPPAYA